MKLMEWRQGSLWCKMQCQLTKVRFTYRVALWNQIKCKTVSQYVWSICKLHACKNDMKNLAIHVELDEQRNWLRISKIQVALGILLSMISLRPYYTVNTKASYSFYIISSTHLLESSVSHTFLCIVSAKTLNAEQHGLRTSVAYDHWQEWTTEWKWNNS